MTIRPLRAFFVLAGLAGCLTLAACDDDPLAPDIHGRELGVVLTSTDLSLTLFDVDDPSTTETVGLGPDGSPVSLAVRGRLAAVPMGIVPGVAVVDLSAATLLRTIGLPEGSGATGVAFLNDSIVLVGNPDLDTVIPVNVVAGTTGPEIEVGRYPQSIVVDDGQVFVINAELEAFVPAGPSTITVLDAGTLAVVDTIELSGENAASATVDDAGDLWVIHSGNYGAANGALSRVDPATRTETGFFEGFGSFPGSVAAEPDGLLFITSFEMGTLVWSTATETFARGPDQPLTPGGVASTSAVGTDSEGRLYALVPDCQAPAEVHRLDGSWATELTIPVGICPLAIAFTEVEAGP